LCTTRAASLERNAPLAKRIHSPFADLFSRPVAEFLSIFGETGVGGKKWAGAGDWKPEERGWNRG
jgi:hypothetical protein